MPLPDRRPDPAMTAAVRRRDEGRRRVRGTTGWALAAAVAGTAVLGAGYAHAIPGLHTQPSTTVPGSGGNSQNPGKLGAPGQAPGTTSQVPQTQTGAS